MKDLLPAYAAGSLAGPERDRVGAHLVECASCRAELAGWRAIGDAAAPAGPPPDPARTVRAALTRSALEGSPAPSRDGWLVRRLRHLGSLLVAEARLVRPAVPLASALVLALGVALVLLPGDAAPDGGADLVLALVTPMVAAAGIAGTYRSRRDPAAELVATTPFSGRLLLLVRMVLVFGADLVLALAASATLTTLGAAGATGMHELVNSWLGPMALLSSLSLLMAVWFGPDAALGAAAGVWAARVLAGGVLVPDEWPSRLILEAWSTNAPVLTVSAAVAVAAFATAGRTGSFRGEPRADRRATHRM
ncbi:hypothetical protein Asp14428_68940 [Actinoplanes sp. NBRC 14428]|nr:hypothetical protein Asp14428_68940 [Actinoplanes sp. NBRC 14428]